MMNKEEAIKELGCDVITKDIYELFDAVGVGHNVENSNVVCLDRWFEPYQKPLNDFAKWLTDYKNLNKPDRLSVSDVAILDANDHHCHGVLHIVNGMNGSTRVSVQSLKHVMDIIQHLEDYFGARAWISQVSMHSDVYYYTISFVFWDEFFSAVRHNDAWEIGTFRPLYHLQ